MGTRPKYDKAKNGWNRDWETDNIPDDMGVADPKQTAHTPTPILDIEIDLKRAHAYLTQGEWDNAGAVIEYAQENLAKVRNSHAKLVEALEALYNETADYIRINNLGDVHHNRSMQLAEAALRAAKGESHD